MVSASSPSPEFALGQASLFDPEALAIVLVGTALATFARTGWQGIGNALPWLVRFARSGFDEPANRTALARWVRAVRKSGILGADAPFPPDAALSRALDGLVRSGSLAMFHMLHDAARKERVEQHKRAAQVFEQAGELAPVFGLVGTLFAMTQLAPGTGEDASAAAFGAIASAVLSSLYGVLTANLVCFPIAGAIMRRSAREEHARGKLVNWVADEIADVLPSARADAAIAKLQPAA
ncbi:MAG: MotA/TolQ/ExbB proton channel family protein [Pseudomonadota bacterium]